MARFNYLSANNFRKLYVASSYDFNTGNGDSTTPYQNLSNVIFTQFFTLNFSNTQDFELIIGSGTYIDDQLLITLDNNSNTVNLIIVGDGDVILTKTTITEIFKIIIGTNNPMHLNLTLKNLKINNSTTINDLFVINNDYNSSSLLTITLNLLNCEFNNIAINHVFDSNIIDTTYINSILQNTSIKYIDPPNISNPNFNISLSSTTYPTPLISTYVNSINIIKNCFFENTVFYNGTKINIISNTYFLNTIHEDNTVSLPDNLYINTFKYNNVENSISFTFTNGNVKPTPINNPIRISNTNNQTFLKYGSSSQVQIFHNEYNKNSVWKIIQSSTVIQPIYIDTTIDYSKISIIYSGTGTPTNPILLPIFDENFILVGVFVKKGGAFDAPDVLLDLSTSAAFLNTYTHKIYFTLNTQNQYVISRVDITCTTTSPSAEETRGFYVELTTTTPSDKNVLITLNLTLDISLNQYYIFNSDDIIIINGGSNYDLTTASGETLIINYYQVGTPTIATIPDTDIQVLYNGPSVNDDSIIESYLDFTNDTLNRNSPLLQVGEEFNYIGSKGLSIYFPTYENGEFSLNYFDKNSSNISITTNFNDNNFIFNEDTLKNKGIVVDLKTNNEISFTTKIIDLGKLTKIGAINPFFQLDNYNCTIFSNNTQPVTRKIYRMRWSSTDIGSINTNSFFDFEWNTIPYYNNQNGNGNDNFDPLLGSNFIIARYIQLEIHFTTI